MKRLLLGVLLSLLFEAQNVRAQDTNFMYMSFPGSAAPSFVSKVETQLAEYLTLVDTSNASYLGFTAPISSHTIGDPIPVAVIGLSDSTVQAAKQACAVISIGQVPVFQNGVPGASLEVSGSLPRAGRFGYAALTRRVLSMMDSLVYFAGRPRKTMYLVRVPAFNLVFLARTEKTSGEVYLTPVYSYAEYGLSAGVEEALSSMWPAHFGQQVNRSAFRLR